MSRTHGHSVAPGTTQGTLTYRSWRAMMRRCCRPDHESFREYGARGITVCERWRSFETFLADMGERPSQTTIDRIDGTKGYEPGNCRWATREEQNNNTSQNRRVTRGGETLTVAQWSRRTGLQHGTILQRLRAGWDPAEAVSRPATPRRKRIPRDAAARRHERD